MFITRPEFAEWLPPFAGYTDASGWGIIELVAPLPWFLLEVRSGGSRRVARGGQTFLFGGMPPLAKVLADMGDAKKPRQQPVRVFSFYPPGWEKGTDTWRNSEIAEIWDAQVQVKGHAYSLWLVKTCDGEELLEPAGVEISEPVRKLRRIYFATTLEG